MAIGKSLARFRMQFVRTLESHFVIIVIGLLLGAAGILLHISSDHLVALIGMFLAELGFAFIIAVILFGAFEEWAAREHKKSAIAHIYGMMPSGPVFDMIEKNVLQQRFYRSKLVVTYAFKEQVDETILVEQTTKYVVTNACSRDESSTLELGGNTDLKPLHTARTDWDDDLGLESLTLIRKCGEDLIPEVVAEEKIERKPDTEFRTESYRMTEGIPLAFEERIGVEAFHRLVVHDHDATVWTSGLPSQDLEFRVTWDEPIRLKFAFSATHPVLGDLRPEKEPNSQVVRLAQPFLKGHGIHIRWSPDDSEPDPAPPAGRPGEGDMPR